MLDDITKDGVARDDLALREFDRLYLQAEVHAWDLLQDPSNLYLQLQYHSSMERMKSYDFDNPRPEYE